MRMFFLCMTVFFCGTTQVKAAPGPAVGDLTATGAPGDPQTAGTVALAGTFTFGSLNLVRSLVGIIGESVSLKSRRPPREWTMSGYIIGASSVVQGAATLIVGATQPVPSSEAFLVLGATNL